MKYPICVCEMAEEGLFVDGMLLGPLDTFQKNAFNQTRAPNDHDCE